MNVDRYSQMALAATLELQVFIASAVAQAQIALGLPVNSEAVEEARRRAVRLSPRYVEGIHIEGTVACEMYDEHPGLAYFYPDAVECVDVPGYCGLARAKALAYAAFLAFKATAAECDDTREGDFSPHSIVLTDQFGAAMSSFAAGQWLDEAPLSEDEWPAALEKANSLEREAHEESRWDNFETSRGLSKAAVALRRRVESARLAHLAIP